MADLKEVNPRFRNLDEAARIALIKALNAAGIGDIEYGGLIFQDRKNGGYYNSGLVPGTKDNINMRGRREAPGDDLAGGYHSHPPADRKGVFSEIDQAGALNSGVPIFIGKAHDRQARVFDSNVDSPRNDRKSLRVGGPHEGRPFRPGERMEPEISPEILALLRAPSE
jgi:proteasome lid subunit RPN8/RPN11